MESMYSPLIYSQWHNGKYKLDARKDPSFLCTKYYYLENIISQLVQCS